MKKELEDEETSQPRPFFFNFTDWAPYVDVSSETIPDLYQPYYTEYFGEKQGHDGEKIVPPIPCSGELPRQKTQKDEYVGERDDG